LRGAHGRGVFCFATSFRRFDRFIFNKRAACDTLTRFRSAVGKGSWHSYVFRPSGCRVSAFTLIELLSVMRDRVLFGHGVRLNRSTRSAAHIIRRRANSSFTRRWKTIGSTAIIRNGCFPASGLLCRHETCGEALLFNALTAFRRVVLPAATRQRSMSVESRDSRGKSLATTFAVPGKPQKNIVATRFLDPWAGGIGYYYDRAYL